MQGLVDGVEFGDDVGIQHEGVRVRVAEGGVELVSGEGEEDPAVDGVEELVIERRGVRHLQGVSVESIGPEVKAVEFQTKPLGGVQGVFHVQIVGKGFCPVFPWMAAGIGADETDDPVGIGAILMMERESGGVVGALVTKGIAESLQPGAVFSEPLPIIVGQLMPHVTCQSAIGFAHLFLDESALGGVGFGQVEGDETFRMSSQEGARAGQGLEEIKPHAVRVNVFGSNGEAESQELDEDVALGVLSSGPSLGGSGEGEVGRDAGEGAGEALCSGIRSLQHPVALVRGFAASASFEGSRGEIRKGVDVGALAGAGGLDRGKGEQAPEIRDKPYQGTTPDAGSVFAEKRRTTGANGGGFSGGQRSSNR